MSAAWARLFPEGDSGYGFVNATTPEVALGVAQWWRNRGAGFQQVGRVDGSLTYYSGVSATDRS